MTNHWIDMQHAKTILVEGSNVAENHPMAYKWIRLAQEKGAKLIHVDPRFTRTSAGADVYARIRPGTDAAFLNTMINHILVNGLYDEDFVTTHTNALFLIHPISASRMGSFPGMTRRSRPTTRRAGNISSMAKRGPGAPLAWTIRTASSRG
jgi:formate dehydrogenase major subunit